MPGEKIGEGGGGQSIEREMIVIIRILGNCRMLQEGTYREVNSGGGNVRRKETSPRVWQDSRGRLGRGCNAKTAHNSKIFGTN